MTKAIQVTTSGTISIIDSSSLTALQNGVGGWVQAICLSDTLTMWLNEEGKLQALPRNATAQIMWDNTFGPMTDIIVGDVVFTGGADDEGMTLPLSEEDEATVMRALATAQAIREGDPWAELTHEKI